MSACTTIAIQLPHLKLSISIRNVFRLPDEVAGYTTVDVVYGTHYWFICFAKPTMGRQAWVTPQELAPKDMLLRPVASWGVNQDPSKVKAAAKGPAAGAEADGHHQSSGK